MSGNNSANNRFPLPDEWDVEGVVCMVIPVPDDAQYIEIMRGLIDTLTWQRSFNQHPTENAAYQVSRTWQRAFEHGITFQECDMPDFRIDPDTCLLEVDCGDGNWQPVFTSEHPGGEPEIPYPPDTPEYEDDTARCIAAANITAQLKYGTETLANDATIIGGIAIAIINLLGAFLFFVPGGVLVDIAIAILDLAVGHTSAEFVADLADIDWDRVRDHLACYLNRDGSISEAGKTMFRAWMDDQYPGNLAWGLAKIIIDNIDADGMTTDARIPQDDIDTVCDTDVCLPDCVDTHNGTSWIGVYGYPDPPPYIAGLGVRSAGFSGITGFHIQNGGFAGATINEFSITVNLLITGDSPTWELKYDDVTVHTFTWISGVHTYVFSTPTAASTIRCFMDIGSGSIGSPTDPAALITEICVVVAD